MTAKKKAKDSEYVLVFNVNSQELYLANANSIELFDYGYCIERDKNAIQKLGEEGKFLGDSKKGVIKFKKVDFFGEEKTIKEIEISAKGDYLLKVRIGRNTKIFRLTSGKKKVPIYIKGEEVDVEIETGDIKFELDSIELIYNE